MVGKQKQIILFLIIVFIIGLITTCSKSPKCWGDDINEGIINSSIRIDCEPINNQLQQYIIMNDSTYKNSFISTCTLPSIDFNTYSLLGLYADGACEIKFIRTVSQLENENKYHYKVIVKSCGACKKLGMSYNWVTVPKLPNSWTVTFEVINK